MSEWQTVNIGSCVKTNLSSIGKKYELKEIQYLDTGSITCNRIDGYQQYKIEEAPSRAKRLVQHEDIIYSSVRPNQLHYGFITMPPKDLVVSTGFVVITCIPTKISPKFLYYYLTQNSSTDYLHSIAEASTSAYPSLKPSDIEALEIDLPPLPEQKAIASVLSALDDKIDFLHRQNKTLEAMAETLFRQWFVEEADDSWMEVKLQDVAKRITDGAHASPPSVEYGLPMASVKDMYDWGININTCRKISESDYEKLVKDDCRPLKNDILIAKDGSYLKHIFYANENLGVVILSSIAIIRPNGKYHPTLLSLFLKQKTTINELENIVTGAVIPRIVLKDFRIFPILLPPDNKQVEALKIIQPMIDKCYENNHQIEILSHQRNILIPKLMSGEVRVECK